MKVVLFCGGRGLRLREYPEQIPKPMVPLGYRPILWHVMRYFSHFGHTEFILCLEDVPSAVEPWWRTRGDQAAASSLLGVTTVSRAMRSAGRCR